ncbi:MAG TPA: universal stress protein [Polyangiaceae bacterium]|nr:universal stress protein [Polyangiaceae bacterium]
MHPKTSVIVVGVDFSDLGDRAFQQAYELASASASCEIHAVFVMPASAVNPLTGYAADPLSPESLEEGATQLTKHVNSLLFNLGGLGHSGIHVYSHFRVGVPLFGIVQLATEVQATLIVLGTHGRHGVARWLLGSVAEGVLRQAPCPVLVVPPASASLEVPTIAPVCPNCLDARRASKGETLWCGQHRQLHGRRHTYHPRERGSDASRRALT